MAKYRGPDIFERYCKEEGERKSGERTVGE
jgi:hypothetical protein